MTTKKTLREHLNFLRRHAGLPQDYTPEAVKDEPKVEAKPQEEVLQEGEKGLDVLIQDYLDFKKIHRFEGPSAIRNLEILFKALDENYRDTDAFLSDNPGACEAIIEWLGTVRSKEWKERLKALTPPQKEDDDDGN